MDDDEDHQEDRTPCQTTPIVGDLDVPGSEDGGTGLVEDREGQAQAAKMWAFMLIRKPAGFSFMPMRREFSVLKVTATRPS